MIARTKAALELSEFIRTSQAASHLLTVGVGGDGIIVYVATNLPPTLRSIIPDTWSGFPVKVRRTGAVRPA